MEGDVLDVYVGWDQRESVAYDVCRRTLIAHSSAAIHLRPIKIRPLRFAGIYRRHWYEKNGQRYDKLDGKPFSTEFSFARFLVPALNGYEGWALFCDCDFMFRADVAELFALRDERYAIMCVKHAHVPEERLKMEGAYQTRYARKNWSSLVLWNCGHPSNMRLTVDAVNTEPGQWLHAFDWLTDDEIGEIPVAWNWLEGSSDPVIDPKAVHFTRGGPWFPSYQDVAFADEWRQAQKELAAG